MSFAEAGPLIDAFNTFQRVCKANGFRAFKVDQHFDSRQRIVPSIISSIRRSAFIIADLTEPRPNVYYELGYAQALGKDILTTAQKGTELPFDVFDIPHFWDSQHVLEQKLQIDVKSIAERFGRRQLV
jgi:nucleoside 2-deoxyribosyltransferase